MIEVGERSEQKVTYDEAVLYVFCLSDGWRLPTQEEYYGNKYINGSFSWYVGRDTASYNKWYVTPVRDLKDD
jgi:hypothetical protein